MPTLDARLACHRLLDWNRQHLTAASVLGEADIATRFAPQFTVKANGRTYAANYRNYLEFLDGFRRTIQSIDYDLHALVAEGDQASVAMTARVHRLDGTLDRFEAMLLLAFDAQGLVTLWHEVYLPL
ncbi:nuclear transport factor 2 family protein [Dyella sp. ASV21]|jgi:hypothetical protein|uniref:nuclear transport factor 2 family protein n=1 Tax=Dyella sp. ASV21 TaxID=2795114 RepID=UPI0018EC8143|nr:nuclear transport factor 2 family protein [Dyella sp. ASV21]